MAVDPEALVEAMTELLPYRRQHAPANARALAAGAAVPAVAAAAPVGVRS